MEYYSVTKRNEILPFVITQMDLEDIMLSEIRQTEKEILYDFTYMLNPKSKTNEQIKQKRKGLIDTENKLVVARRERGQGTD